MTEHFLRLHTFMTVPQVFRLKLILTWVPLDVPLQEELVSDSSRPPTSSFGTETSMLLGLHITGTGIESRIKR